MCLGLSESRWQNLVKRGRNYSREMAEAKTDDEAIQIAVDAVGGLTPGGVRAAIEGDDEDGESSRRTLNGIRY